MRGGFLFLHSTDSKSLNWKELQTENSPNFYSNSSRTYIKFQINFGGVKSINVGSAGAWTWYPVSLRQAPNHLIHGFCHLLPLFPIKRLYAERRKLDPPLSRPLRPNRISLSQNYFTSHSLSIAIHFPWLGGPSNKPMPDRTFRSFRVFPTNSM